MRAAKRVLRFRPAQRQRSNRCRITHSGALGVLRAFQLHAAQAVGGRGQNRSRADPHRLLVPDGEPKRLRKLGGHLRNTDVTSCVKACHSAGATASRRTRLQTSVTRSYTKKAPDAGLAAPNASTYIRRTSWHGMRRVSGAYAPQGTRGSVHAHLLVQVLERRQRSGKAVPVGS